MFNKGDYIVAMYYTPNELVEYVEDSAVKKATRPYVKLFILSIFAGALIGFGAIGSYVVSGSMLETNAGLAKFIGAAVFPVGLIVVILGGFELFTSDCLMTMGVMAKKIKWVDLIRTLVIVYLGNLVGSLIVSYVTAKVNTLYPAAAHGIIHTAEAKVHLDAMTIFLKGTMANVLVALGAMVAYASKDWVGKIAAAWFVIMLFVVLGYEHSIANMTYIPTAMWLGAPITILEFIYNLIFSTIGNFIGGGVLVGLSYYYTQK